MKKEKEYKVFAINPGSTSTKIGLFQGDKCLFSKTVEHDAKVLQTYETLSNQLQYRRDTIMELLKENNIDLSDVDAYVGRGGGLMAVEGGVYSVGAVLLNHANRGANGIQHPANLGSQLAHEFGVQYGRPAYVVNPPDTDELCDLARVTGIKGVYRHVHLHALNLKETAIRHSAKMGKRYEECNYIVCHIGGGISISAHQNGRMIDGTDIVGGEGPMAPNRCGSVPIIEFLRYAQGKDPKELRALCMKTGGFVSLLGTADTKEIVRRAAEGDKAAKRAWDALLYQIIKFIGSMATTLHGKVDGILLGGGMVHNEELVQYITDTCGWIAPVYPYPGEFELEAMAAGAIRVLKGEEQVKEYTGRPRWTGFEDEEE